ncbi:hypothetical protein TNCV_1800061 [Trichonephila clavipes]|nr:hypothetical protein TNCV_1800061 [Trichonephila clavipes]
MKNQTHTSWIPSSRPISVMPLSRMQKLLNNHAQPRRFPDMDLRTVLQSRCPNRNAYSTKNNCYFFRVMCFWTATAGSDVVQSGRPIFDDFFQHLWPYIGNNTANVVFQMVKRLWLIRIDQ